MKYDELILKLKEEKAFADVKADYYRKRLTGDENSLEQILWATYVLEFETRSNTLYGVLYLLEKMEENDNA